MSDKHNESGIVSPRTTPKTVLRKEPKIVEASITKKRSRKFVPKFAAPPTPSQQQLEEEARFMLSKQEHNKILSALKKFCFANKQILAVSRTVAQKLSTLDSSKRDFLNAQLQLARTELLEKNHSYSEDIKLASQNVSHIETVRVAYLIQGVAESTSVICAGMKAVVLEASDDIIFRSVLTSIVTARESLVNITEIFQSLPEKLDTSLSNCLSAHTKNLNLMVRTLVACSSGKVIPFGRKLELEAAAQAATCSVVKLITSFSRPIEKSIIYETKIASSCISQLWATLNELSGSPNLISLVDEKAMISKFLSQLKSRLAELMECTKNQVSNHSNDSFNIMNEKAKPLRELLRDIVANINRLADLDTSSDIDVISTITEEHIKRAEIVTADPSDLVPAPPSIEKVQTLDLPDNYVKDADIIWDEPESDKGRVLYTDSKNIRCATLNKLLLNLTSKLDMTYMKTFVTTYRSFTSPSILLSKIIQLYNVPANKFPEEKKIQIQLRCANLLKQWVDSSYSDFSENDLEELSSFINVLSQNSTYSKIAKFISTLIEKKKAERENTTNDIVSLTIEEKIPLSPANLIFSTYSEETIAQQLTLVDFYIYKAIKPAELLNQAWSKEKYRHRAKNVLTLISRSTSMARWVASVILWQDTLKGRVKALTKFINIANHMRKINNFNSVMAILAGINTASCHRLKFTREGLSQKSRDILKELSDLMSSGQSYATYRSVLHDIDPPCIPFLGTYLTDITFIEDGNPDYIQGLINYRKRELVYNVIREIQQYQQKSYSFPVIETVGHYLYELPYSDESLLYDLSIELEPRKTKSADELL